MTTPDFITKLENTNTSGKPEPISGSTIQLIIGGLGIFLPVILIFGAKIFGHCELVQNSISAYYHTNMQDFFVGTLCSVAIGLFAYYGYSKLDNMIANFAAFLALGVAFFPTSVGYPLTDCISNPIETGIIGNIHYISAALLFLTFAFFQFSCLQKTGGNPTREKLIRNNIYKICGYLMILFIILIAIYSFCLREKYDLLDKLRPVFWLEAFSLLSFSISWLVKSGIILKINDGYAKKYC